MNIPDFLEINDQLWTSGQPAPEDFALLSRTGVEVIINLAAPGSTRFLADEPDWVLKSGAQYIHLPISWTAPKVEDFVLFTALLQACAGRRVLVHCARNMRVSVFVYLYTTLIEDEDERIAHRRMERIWTPDAIWSAFIEEAKQGVV